MGYCTSNHYHIALNINKQWQSVLDYTKRDRNLVLVGSPWSNPYDKWSFYNDRSIAFIDNSKPTPTPKTYTVKSGDNLTNIIKRYYNITDYDLAHLKMLEVARFNNFDAFQRNNLKIGQIVKLP
jgi:hypothetical protein